MSNTQFGENTLYVQRMFSIQQRQYADNQVDNRGGKTFWQKHKGKILAGAALAAAGGLGYTFRNEIADAVSPNTDSSSRAKRNKPPVQFPEWSLETELKEIDSSLQSIPSLSDKEWIVAVGNLTDLLEARAIDKKFAKVHDKVLLFRDRLVSIIKKDPRGRYAKTYLELLKAIK